jgi:hypothetical protein
MNQNKTIKSHCVQEFGVPKKVARNHQMDPNDTFFAFYIVDRITYL